MTSRDFCYWLQGFFELGGTNKENSKVALTVPQVIIIQNHLNLVFKHEIDPSMPDPTGALQAIHDGKPILNECKPPVPFNPSNPISNWPFPDTTTYRC